MHTQKEQHSIDIYSNKQLELLAAIDSEGSISAAAKVVGISYKTAWDRIEALNNLSKHPLLKRSAGGAKGRGTALTKEGNEVVKGYKLLQKEHRLFINEVGGQPTSLQDIADFNSTSFSKLSSRNQLAGTISAIQEGDIEAEIMVALNDNASIAISSNSHEHSENKLKIGDSVILNIKPSSIIICKDKNIQTSARNKLFGPIVRLVENEVNSEVIVDIGSEKSLFCVITNRSIKELELKIGTEVADIFKASTEVII